MWAIALNWMLKDPVKTTALVACAMFAAISVYRGHELKTARMQLHAYEVEREALLAAHDIRAAEVKAQNESARAAAKVAAQEREKLDAATSEWERRAAARDRDLWLCRRTPRGAAADVPGVRDDPAGEADTYRPVTDGPVGRDARRIVAAGERYRVSLAQCYATLDANR